MIISFSPGRYSCTVLRRMPRSWPLPDTEQSGNADGGIGIALPGAEYGHSPVRREIAFLFLPERRQCHGAYGTHQTLEYGIHHLFHPIPFSPSAQQPCHACAQKPEKKEYGRGTRGRNAIPPPGNAGRLRLKAQTRRQRTSSSGYGNPEKRPPEPGNIREREIG